MRVYYYAFLLLFGNLLASSPFCKIYGQPDREGELKIVADQFGQSDEVFLQTIGGEVYTNTVPLAKGSPYFPNPQWISGVLFTRKHRLENVLLKYDAYHDQLLYLAKDGDQLPVSLNPSQLEGFLLLAIYFKHFSEEDSLPFSGYAASYSFKKFSFYEKIYSKLDKGTDDPFGTHSLKHQYYLDVKGRYFLIKNRNDLLEAFSDKSDLIKTYLKKNKFSIRRLGTQQFLQILSYYDSL